MTSGHSCHLHDCAPLPPFLGGGRIFAPVHCVSNDDEAVKFSLCILSHCRANWAKWVALFFVLIGTGVPQCTQCVSLHSDCVVVIVSCFSGGGSSWSSQQAKCVLLESAVHCLLHWGMLTMMSMDSLTEESNLHWIGCIIHHWAVYPTACPASSLLVPCSFHPSIHPSIYLLGEGKSPLQLHFYFLSSSSSLDYPHTHTLFCAFPHKRAHLRGAS